jgi:hypothetical protein
MTIHIEFLHQRQDLRELLREHGWRLDKKNGGFAAEHPAVHDQAAARQNLQALGLLTSAAVRIEFGPSHRSGIRSTVN